MVTKEKRELLAEQFDRHVDEEGKIIDEYRSLADTLGSGPLGFVTDLILAEEEMHHLLFTTMAKWLREPHSPEEDVGSLKVDDEEFLKRTHALKQHEKETIRATHALRDEIVGEDAELLDALLETMALDSEKHFRLLTIIEKLLAP